jgi:hypothetical protein
MMKLFPVGCVLTILILPHRFTGVKQLNKNIADVEMSVCWNGDLKVSEGRKQGGPCSNGLELQTDLNACLTKQRH